MTAIALVVVVLHGFWSFYLDQGNRADLDKSYIYEEEQRLALGMSEETKPGNDIHQIVTSMSRRKWFPKRWGHITQVAVTGILAAGAIALAWLR